MHKYLTTNNYMRRVFGSKIYKLSLSAATTCPNRDGKIGFGGCTFCSSGGSGDFAAQASLPIDLQIAQAKARLGKKGENLKYLAYFQAFTGTYGDLDYLEKLYLDACSYPEIVGISIATRPDCLGNRAMKMLKNISAVKPLWIELGLQTVHETTATNINRGYSLSVYDEAMEKLKTVNAHRITHVILGLPGETRDDILATVKYVGQKTDGIKLQLLHVLENTRLAESFRAGDFKALEPEQYYELVADCLEVLPETCIIHRLTGDGPKKLLVAPLWSGNKKRVMIDMERALKNRGIERVVY